MRSQNLRFKAIDGKYTWKNDILTFFGDLPARKNPWKPPFKFETPRQIFLIVHPIFKEFWKFTNCIVSNNNKKKSIVITVFQSIWPNILEQTNESTSLTSFTNVLNFSPHQMLFFVCYFQVITDFQF